MMQSLCVFCTIVQKKIPSYRVFEDDLFLGFLDIQPRVRGHTLLIPKKHYQWVYDVPQFKNYWHTVLIITKALKKALLPQFVTYITHGLEVSHAHIHILPRHNETAFMPNPINISAEEMKKIADRIAHSIKSFSSF